MFYTTNLFVKLLLAPILERLKDVLYSQGSMGFMKMLLSALLYRSLYKAKGCLIWKKIHTLVLM